MKTKPTRAEREELLRFQPHQFAEKGHGFRGWHASKGADGETRIVKLVATRDVERRDIDLARLVGFDEVDQ